MKYTDIYWKIKEVAGWLAMRGVWKLTSLIDKITKTYRCNHLNIEI